MENINDWLIGGAGRPATGTNRGIGKQTSIDPAAAGATVALSAVTTHRDRGWFLQSGSVGCYDQAA